MKHIAKNEDVGLQGYGGYSFKEDDSFHSITLFLPNRLLQTLRDEQLAAEEAQKAHEDEELLRLQST